MLSSRENHDDRPPARTAILISGRGSNMEAIVAAAREPDYPAEIVLVLSNRPDAAGLAWATGEGIATETVDHSSFQTREDFDAALSTALNAANVELVVLAGFMRRLGPEFVNDWRGRLINIHPSLLPSFRGLDVHNRMLEAGVRVAGCTTHFVEPDVDAGAIIAQAAVPVDPSDDAEALSARILRQEHRIYPETVAAVASGRCRLEGGRAVWSARRVFSDETDALQVL
ncbi:MAG: phosphoribosylglycinamide formyltransferase [Pseudomonadota bacterium]